MGYGVIRYLSDMLSPVLHAVSGHRRVTVNGDNIKTKPTRGRFRILMTAVIVRLLPTCLLQGPVDVKGLKSDRIDHSAKYNPARQVKVAVVPRNAR